jgi:hypothetical protein
MLHFVRATIGDERPRAARKATAKVQAATRFSSARRRTGWPFGIRLALPWGMSPTGGAITFRESRDSFDRQHGWWRNAQPQEPAMFDFVLHLPAECLLSSQWNDLVAACHRRELVSAARRTLFVLAWLFIGAVSVYDAWLVKLYQVCILEVELNPIAWYLIKSGGNDVTGFLLTKAVSTAVVLVILAALYMHTPRLAYPVIASVSAFQMSLLLFLTFA